MNKCEHVYKPWHANELRSETLESLVSPPDPLAHHDDLCAGPKQLLAVTVVVAVPLVAVLVEYARRHVL